jgi:class 3 adenylate cyclase
MTAARRLAAILAADVAGYSRPMGEDEAETARRFPDTLAERFARGPRRFGIGSRVQGHTRQNHSEEKIAARDGTPAT